MHVLTLLFPESFHLVFRARGRLAWGFSYVEKDIALRVGAALLDCFLIYLLFRLWNKK